VFNIFKCELNIERAGGFIFPGVPFADAAETRPN
jgi:hypothetical protein